MEPLDRQLLLIGVLLTGLFISVATPVVAHGNYLAADSQITTDGTIRIEGVFMVTEGWVVLHTDNQGEIGDIIGHTKSELNVFQSNLTVSVKESYWANATGRMRLWAVLHFDANNDGAFDPSSDPPIGGHDDPNQAVQLDVLKGNDSAFVLTEFEDAQQADGSEVVIRRVRLPVDGYLVIQTDANGAPGDPVGQLNLTAGLYEDVTISIAEHYYHHQPEHFSLWAVIYRGDGDAGFDEGDNPVTVNGSPIASRFEVKRTGDLEAGHEHTPSATETAQSTLSTTTTLHEDDHDHQHPANSSPTPTSRISSDTVSPTGANSPTSAPGQPGMGMTAVLLAFLLMLVGKGLLSD